MKNLAASLFFILGTVYLGFAQQNLDFFLIARNTGEKVLANNDTIRVFGFAQSLGAQPGVPGPTLIMNEGDSAHIDLWNVSQGAPHTIHLHGLDVDQQNDGVPHLSFDIHHMDHGYYHFKAPHAGTYLYHCHVASTIHVQAGMYGLIIVKPSDGSNTTWNDGHSYTTENSYFLSEIDTNWHTDSVLMHDHDTSATIHQVEIPDFNPQFFMINGLSDQQLIDSNVVFSSAVNQVDYTRLANIGYCGVRVIFPAALNARIVASDGRPLPVEELSDTVYLFPGERFGVLTEPDAEFTDQIVFDYIDMNTMNVKNSQVIPVNVSGFASINDFDSQEMNVAVMPNPFDDQTIISFHLNGDENVNVQLLDLNGRVIEEHFDFYQEGENQLVIGSDLSVSGLYVLKVMTRSGVNETVKVVRL